MKPIAIDAAQTIHESLPTVAATAPMENRTRGGTPLATQNAPVQSIPRSRPALFATPASAVMLMGYAQISTGSKRPRPKEFVSKRTLKSKTFTQLLGDFKN